MEANALRRTIARAKAGESDAFDELLSDYGNRLYGYFYRATGRHHDAEDLLSEVSLRLVRTLQHYNEQGRFEPWLFRIAANLVRDRIRRFKTRPTPMSLSAEDRTGRSMEQRIPDGGPGVEAGLVSAEAGERLKAALDQLDETTREMILLRHFGDLSFKEIAERFDCPLGTALARVHRGIKALRAKLENDIAVQPDWNEG